ncbi:MAG: DUF2029 domain-containing protein [Planctomycetota bacterium]|nr:MAG: DUF2029 domain-containing protein [Planctomycetota bacterium]
MQPRARAFLRFWIWPTTRYVIAWLVALGTAAYIFYSAWTSFDSDKKPDGSPRRRGGNSGHAMIDFGGQWLMGRMLVQGYGQHLYHRNYQWVVARAAYPVEDEIPPEDRREDEKGHDFENLMSWLMGNDNPDGKKATAGLLAPLAARDALAAAALLHIEARQGPDLAIQATAPRVGGPLYPPIQACLMYPLGRLPPTQAYRLAQVIAILMAFLSAWGIRVLSQGRIWWPVAVTAVLIYPGFAHGINLGQNPALTLAILVWGWVCIAAGREVSGGMVWGLLAFKPVWALAYFLVPLLTGRWRICLAMVATGIGLALATLPLVGWHAWFEWLQIGRDASELYAKDRNWIFLSRDLLTIPRRWLLDFDVPHAERTSLTATLLGWALLVAALACTVVVTLSRRDRGRVVTGPGAAFMFLGAWLACYHFMFYDLLLTALPALLLLTEPRRYLEPRLVAITALPNKGRFEEVKQFFRPRLATGMPEAGFAPVIGLRNVFVLNSVTLTLLILLLVVEYPLQGLKMSVSVAMPRLENKVFPTPIVYSTGLAGTPLDTFCLIALWMWCGWLWLRTPVEEPALDAASDAASGDSRIAGKVDAAQLV